MQCPVCYGTTHIDVDTHADGFASNLEECGDCGALWTSRADNKTILIHGSIKRVVNA